MRAVHVGALPFPSPQGTQAAIARMLTTLAEAGESPTLYCYDGGTGEPPTGVRLVRHGRARSLRSGPSIEKLAADVALARALGRERGLDVVVAHHVEAALAALAADVAPVLFVAHTALGPELPTYFPDRVAVPAAWLGETLDRALLGRASAVAAVSPLLATMLARRAGRVVHPLPIPWPVARDAGLSAEDARRALGLRADRDVVLYAGNLDRYQGLDVLAAALERLLSRRAVQLLVATEAPREGLARALGASLAAEVVRAPLATELDRARAHAAATLVAVPRRSPGGIPVKLLDALARGVPVVCAERAMAGHPLATVCQVARDDDPDALTAALERGLDEGPDARALRIGRGRAQLARDHGPAAFLPAYRQALADAAAGPRTRG